MNILNQKQHILVGIISMDIMLLNRLLASMKLINLRDIQIDFIVFMNNHNSGKPLFDLAQSTIKYLPLDDDLSLEIASARNFLQEKIFNHCRDNQIEPIVWLLDEDIEIDNRANEYLSRLSSFKKNAYDVLIGSIEEDSPNAAFSGMRVQLFDLIENLKWLDSLDDSEYLPSREKSNQKLRKEFPNYYYDLTSDVDKGHLYQAFWLLPSHNKESVGDAKKRIYLHLDDILSGKNFFRPIKQEKINKYEKSLLRGANTFILNLNVLRVKQPAIKVKDNIIRRSDMLWALINQEFFNRNIIKVDFTVLHKRQKKPKKELSVEKTVNELCGSIIFNSLRLFYENNQKISFEEILSKQIYSKVRAVEESFSKTIEYIDILNSLDRPELLLFSQQLKAFYTVENLNLIIEKIKRIKESKEYIFDKFTSYQYGIVNDCDLITSDYGILKQYDLDDDDIKIFSKELLEKMDKSIPPLIRIHSSCVNSEIFHANDCDCASQLDKAMQSIAKNENGILFYLNQEGRGHGYSKKIAIIERMQKEGINTYDSCKSLGLENDVREYKKVCELVKSFGFTQIKLMSNNPKKIKMIEANGIEVIRKKVMGKSNHQNFDYLQSKEKYANHNMLILTEKMLIERYLEINDRIKFYEKEDAYGEFSNFSDYPFSLDNKYWRTSEHYYQANKFEKNSEIYIAIQQAKTATLAKKIAYSHTVDKKWESKKIPFMYNALYEKFTQNSDLKRLILSTKEAYIIEEAKDDMYWGSGKDGNGKNILGRLLMFLRDEFEETKS